MRYEDLRAPRLVEGTHEFGDTTVDDVVAEVDDEPAIADELPAHGHRMCQTAGRLLSDVGGLDAEAAAVLDGLHDLISRRPSHYQANILDACGGEGFQRVLDDGLVRHRQEMLGAGVRQGSHPRSEPRAQDHGLHLAPPWCYSGSGWCLPRSAAVHLVFEAYRCVT